MPLEKITEKILKDAQAAAEGILEKARNDAEKIKAQTDRKIKEREVRRTREIETQAVAKKNQMVNSAVRLARNKVLRRKQEWINRVFEEAKKDILALPEKEYLSFLADLAKSADLAGEEKIGMASKDLPLKNRLRKILLKTFPGNRFEFGESPFPIEAGLVIRRGEMLLNASVKALLNELREMESQEVVHLLFSEDGGNGA